MRNNKCCYLKPLKHWECLLCNNRKLKMFLFKLGLTWWFFDLTKFQRRLLSRKIFTSPYIKYATPPRRQERQQLNVDWKSIFFSLVFSGADESLHNFSSILLVSQWKQKRWFIRYPYFQSPCMQFLTHIPSWKYKMSHITFDHWWLICWELQTSLNKWEMCVSSPQKNTSVWRKKLLHTISAVSWIL